MSDLLLFLAIVLNAVLGFLIFWRNRRSKENIFYALFVLFTDLWMIANFLENEPSVVGYERLDLFLRLDFISAAFGMYFWLKFCTAIALRAEYVQKWHRWLGWITAMLAIAFVPLVLSTQLVIKNISFYDSVIHFDSGPLWIIYALFILTGLLIGPLILFTTRRFVSAIGNELLARNINFILLGFIIALGNAVIINLLQPILMISLEVSRIGIYGLSILVVFTAYAIVKYSLFDLKIIATEALTGVLWIVLISNIVVPGLLGNRISDIFIFALSLIFGFLLIKSVREEVRQREEVERLNKELEKANIQLGELNRFKTQLLSLASHQIKSPLAAIKGFVSIISEGLYGPVNDKVKDALGKVKDSADGLIGLINNLLDLRKVDEGKMDYYFAKTDMSSLVNGVISMLQPIADSKKITLSFSKPDGGVFLSADSEKLKQVVQNLIDNAIKYTPRGFVRVELRKSGKRVELSVSDSGLGVSKELLPLIFEEFVRDERIKTKILGTGLGLYIARKIVEAHGGKIWVESEGEGKGSKFSVSLPAA
ncbi:MAG TPA: ATP-binding protein [Candidatus Paceibacterota bacterium]|nr:ATP-binding protein [Candidatus Paceibacterota bacterium]